MWLRFQIALRNSFRNKRRSILNICMIAGAVSTIIVFEGFTHYMVMGLRETTIETQTGHLQLANTVYWNRTAEQKKDNIIKDSERIIAEIQKDKRVKYVVGRTEFFALASLGNRSISARTITLDPQKESSRNKYFKFIRGKPLHPKKPFQIALGRGLAQQLRARSGDRVSVLTQTYDGVVNAIDVEVSGIFSTDIKEFDDSTMLLPLQTAQRLLDSKGVEQIIVGLKDTSTTEAMQYVLQAKLARARTDIQVKDWESVSTLYRQVSTFNRVQNLVVQSILMALVLLSILNTVGMSIAERTGEIGTVRALGERRKTIVIQFLLEGFVLGLSGVIVGTAWGFLSAKGFNAMQVPMTLPGASTPIFVQIDIVANAIAMGAILGISTTLIAAVLPATRASKLNVVEALRHNV